MARKRKDPPTEEDTAVLPPELIEIILSKLPSKSILQCKTVCKLWNGIISSPHFIKMQSDQASSSSRCRFVVHESLTISSGARKLRLLKFEGQTFQREPDELPIFSYRSDILCSCNGIVLLRRDPTSCVYILLNPCTRKYIKISTNGYSEEVAYGLLYDPITNDYKVVIVTAAKTYSVFSLRKKSWTIADEDFPKFEYISKRGVYVDGALHWIRYRSMALHDPKEIIFFDGVNDKCGKLQLPTKMMKELEYSSMRGDLTTVQGCLSFCYRYVEEGSRKTMVIRMSIMGKNGGEFSDKEVMRTNRLGYPCTKHKFRPYCNNVRPPCPINNDMVMVFLNCSEYLIYDAREERVVGKTGKLLETWDSVVVQCPDHLFFPIDTHLRPWRKCRRAPGRANM